MATIPHIDAADTNAAAGAREATFDIFRRFGYLQASLDPLGQYLGPQPFPVAVPDSHTAAEARNCYSGTIGLEFMHILGPAPRLWLRQQMEHTPAPPNHAHILSRLIRADLFEQVIQSRYLGTKRFSLEGLTVLIPFLDCALETASGLGIATAVLAMSHRGRLNVMTNTIGRTPAEIFARFEDVNPHLVLGGGDVKYHMGATGEYRSPSGTAVGLHLVSNPSHLEAVDPVAMGRARAKQIRIGGRRGREAVIPITMHGDAAFAGQGILAECLVLSALHGYRVGGTVHVVVNNLLGFTATPEESNSSRFATDIALRLQVPIFHVNAEDPDAVVRVAAIATEYRHRFRTDVVVDLIGYRRHGHSEVDDPTVTQPRRYAAIKDHPPLYKIYADRIGVNPDAECKQIQQELLEGQKQASRARHKPRLVTLPDYWAPYHGGSLRPEDEVATGLPPARVGELARLGTVVPAGFHLHPKVKKLFDQRLEMAAGTRAFDYGMAELTAFASLLVDGTPVRLSGQDSQRGTFNQRHSAVVDIETEQKYLPLAHIREGQGRFEAHNSMLSEAAVMGFEYGYSRDYPEALVLWEAQFGDFANGAQIIVDQFVAAGEAKWGLLSGLVLLLPHGYEGQGPEHSSARIERYLHLAANDNIQICQPSTAAQYFHLLRRQALRKWRKPLVVFTPKSMLRHPDASSKLADFAVPHFCNVLPDNAVKSPRRLLVCTGKIGHNLRVEREKRKESAILHEMQGHTAKAHIAIRKLSKLSSAFDQRLNLLVNLVLGNFFFYDVFCMIAAEKWKTRNRAGLLGWIDTVARVEALNTLATYAFNHQENTYPEPVAEASAAPRPLFIETTGLGHPLIPAVRRVANDLTIGRGESLILVTGSNMSGKTTFLRTLGVNLLMAQNGLPVCATVFRFTPLQLLTSLRISDSLQEQTSYFMAELKKLQKIIGSLQTGAPALVLIDEILRGTNSEDKTFGSEQFIRKLLGHQCLSLFATHDLSLGQLEQGLPGQISNYCFESEIINNELHFDYRLARGIARNRNASFLMQRMNII